LAAPARRPQELARDLLDTRHLWAVTRTQALNNSRQVPLLEYGIGEFDGVIALLTSLTTRGQALLH
jgi:hypothetical protein